MPSRIGKGTSASFLLGLEGRVIKADPEVADMVDIDMEMVGWPWAEGTFLLGRADRVGLPGAAAVGAGRAIRACSEGRKLLLDRAFDDGGVNYGNRIILGKMTEPIPGPTALMLIGPRRTTRRAAGAGGVRYLRDQLAASNDLEHLGWARSPSTALPATTPRRRGVPARVDRRIAFGHEPANGQRSRGCNRRRCARR